jgi:hypothetical protein
LYENYVFATGEVSRCVKFFFSLIVSMILIGCTSTPTSTSSRVPTSAPTQDRSRIGAEEYDIFRVIIEPVKDPTEIIVIMDHTRAHYGGKELEESFTRIKENTIGIEDKTINDYIDANAESHLLRNDLDLGFTYIIISEEERREIMHSREMLLGPSHNRGTITFSRVGFTSERDQALVDVGYYPFGQGLQV